MYVAMILRTLIISATILFVANMGVLISEQWAKVKHHTVCLEAAPSNYSRAACHITHIPPQ